MIAVYIFVALLLAFGLGWGCHKPARQSRDSHGHFTKTPHDSKPEDRLP